MKLIAENLMKNNYQGDQPGRTPGMLPGPPPAGPYYWWQAGALWGTLIDYWRYTNDSQFNNVVRDSIVFQGEPKMSFQSDNFTLELGNDDQGFWGLTAMLGAETAFPDPPKEKPQYLALAQGVFNSQVPRWDEQHCGGGLRWQIPPTNPGYTYKNSIANGILFNMGARLGRYTKNETYTKWAEKVWKWETDIGFIDKDWNVYDGAGIETQCKTLHLQQFSYNAAVWIQGCAFMWNVTQKEEWKERASKLTDRTFAYFFPNNIAKEVSCELEDRVQCTTDMKSFKGYLHRWLAQSAQLVPALHDKIMTTLKTSAEAAVKACTPDGLCGVRWDKGSYDGDAGVGQQMNVLGALMSVLNDMQYVPPPVTNATGGTSTGDTNAGTGGDAPRVLRPLSTADQAGASILTALIIISLVGAIGWLITDTSEHGRSSHWPRFGKGKEAMRGA